MKVYPFCMAVELFLRYSHFCIILYLIITSLVLLNGSFFKKTHKETHIFMIPYDQCLNKGR